MTFQAFRKWLCLPLDIRRQTLVMGVLNVTPDSFSDGGKFATVEAAVNQARSMIADGTNLLDIGGESTRPGSKPVPEDEQIRRVVPVIDAIREQISLGNIPPVTLSIDTTRARVAESALDAGADFVNDISAARDDAEMFPMVARRKVPIVLMHMQGTPATMQANPVYSDVTREVCDFLRDRFEAAQTAGINPADVLIDPGIGFGKSAAHNLALIRQIDGMAALARPMVLGVSRKGFIGKIIDEPDPQQRGPGTAAAIAWCMAKLEHAVNRPGLIVRVHDVKLVSQTVRMIEAIADASEANRD